LSELQKIKITWLE